MRSIEGAVHAGLLEKLGGVPQRGQRVAEFVGQHRQELVLALVGLDQPLVEPLQLGVLAGQFPLGGQQFVVQAAQLVVDGNLRRRLPDLLRPPDPGQHPGGVGLPALPLPRLREVQEAGGHVQGLARIRGVAVCAHPPPEFGVHVERVAAHHDLDAPAGLRGPDLGDQLFDARQVEGHRDRDHEQVGPVLFDGLDDAPGGQVGPQVQRVPAVRLEQIGDDAQADLVQLAAHGRRRQPPPLLGQGEQVGVQLRHGQLGRRRAVMLLGDRDLLQLPQPPDLPLAALEDLQVQVADGHARPHRIEDEAAGLVPLGPQEGLEVLPRQFAEGVFPVEERGQGGRCFGQRSQGGFDVGGDRLPHPARQLLAQDIPQAGEVGCHVLRPDAVRRQDRLRPGDVVGEEGGAGVRHRRSEVGKVVLRVLDALGPPALAVPLPQPRLKLVLPGDDGLGQRPALGFNGLTRFSVTIRHGSRYSLALIGHGPRFHPHSFKTPTARAVVWLRAAPPTGNRRGTPAIPPEPSAPAA